MRRVLWLLPLLVGCSSGTPEEAEAAKYPQPKMMSEDEGKKFMAGQNDPRSGGQTPVYPKDGAPNGGSK